MKKTIIYSILIFCILGISFYYFRNHKSTKPSLNDIIFKEYIEHLGLTISLEKTNYILIPKVGCQGAMASVLMELESVLTTTNCLFLIITSNEELVSQYIKKDFKVIIDKNEGLDLLNLPISNVSVIETENFKITKIISSSRCEEKIITKILNQLANC